MKSNKEKSLILNKFKLLIMIMLIAPLFISCGLNYNVTGKVEDSKTGKPVKGAVVTVNWQRTQLGIPGLPTPYENYGTFESITDDNGSFSIPKFLVGHHYMAVYKSGYFCWSSKTIFKPEGKDWKEMFVRRHGHRVKSGMVVGLEPKIGEFPEANHASFIQRVGTRLSSPKPMFNKATKEEYTIYLDNIKSQMKEKLK